jgi:hypothetical protein
MFDYSARERLGVGRADRFTLHSRVGNNERLLLYHRNNDSRLKRRTSAHLSPYADLMPTYVQQSSSFTRNDERS